MRGWKAFLAGAFLLSMSIFALAFEGSVQLFAAETEAQKHCPSDVVVWVNTPTVITISREWVVREHESRCVRVPEGGRSSRISRNQKWTMILGSRLN